MRKLERAGVIVLVCAVWCFAVWWCLLSPLSASAAVLVKNDLGGQLGAYLQKYADLAYSGERITVAGDCNSACTLMLGIIPRGRCAMSGARFGFHSASMGPGGPYSRPGTLIMRGYWPRDVLAILRRSGWDGLPPHPDIIPVDGHAIVRPCGAGELK